ncbi:MAG: hypothetical protein ACXWHZ_19605 [Usitatibacter sp.]
MSEAILRLARQMPGAAAGHFTALTLLALAWSCQAFGYSQPADNLWMVSTGGTVLLGAAALGWLRPQRVGFTAPQAMLLLGAIGMLLGLAIDSRAMDLGTLASLCGKAEKSLWPMLKLHWALLPWMHVGMWVGGFAAIPLLRTIRPTCRRQYCARVAQNIACSVWMTVGMAAGVLLFEYLISQIGERSSASMLGGMFGGMVWGMVASVALYRLYFRMRPAGALQ